MGQRNHIHRRESAIFVRVEGQEGHYEKNAGRRNIEARGLAMNEIL